ncbi:N-acetylglucosamine kinase [Streptomyces sp. NBC_00102]|uniref:N-acetylglucosamine kinase n=1 Tax=Streptomyces sp. NBC_00102 TaxID=2975652 RepID=UPI002257C97B|nr:BadF/BadG/BcrA/BcrD ATPase family protein [Streptomyces sp. NBC_00102]MCX5401614.1 ATPase [Streptomyces sp. NBC_00102]
MTPGAGAYVIGVDSGGSGLRVALGTASAGGPAPVATTECPEPVRTGPDGIDADHLLGQLLPAVDRLTRDAGALAPDGNVCVAALAVGAAGMATLGGHLRARLPQALAASLGVRRLALAADGVTAYAGALGQRPGAVVAGGTGMIALGTDLREWHRADGWGHLLGDSGGGAWIGREGLDAALRAHDGRRGGSPALLARLRAVFGPAPELPGLLYPRTDRPALLASFAPEVAACAADGDAVARSVLRRAAAHIAEAAAAVCPEAGIPQAGERAVGSGGEPVEVALTGGLFRMGDPLLGPLREELARQLPHAALVPASGDPLAGSLLLARALARSDLRLPAHPTLLHVVDDGSGDH